MFKFLFGILFNPNNSWKQIAELPPNSADKGLTYSLVLALLPAFCWYYGTANVGWTVGDGEIIKLTAESALMMNIGFYALMIASICIIGWFIHWMSWTYGAEANSSLTKGIRLAGMCSTPLFLSGVVGLYPSFLLDFTVGLITVSWSTYLLYLGIPQLMNIPKERGFLFATAVLAVCLVMLVGILTVSIISWDYGFAPQFTD